MMLLVLIFAVGPEPWVIHDHCDLIETNHFHDDQARLIFSQRIYYDFDHRTNRYHVRDFRIVKDCNYPVGKTITWVDSGDVLRRVTAKSVRESWSQYDPEMMDREQHPKDLRIELGKPPLNVRRWRDAREKE